MSLPNFCPYPAYKPSGVEWLDNVPAHWEVRRLLTVVDMRVSNVDKHTREDEVSVRLCNYVDVYKNDRITPTMPFMAATASRDEIERFRLESGDVLITKDSETWDDIGVPALVAESAHDLLSGYHLALLRPTTEILGSYLARTLPSKGVAYQFHVRANGVTRYGLTHTGIQAVRIPLPPLPEQVAIVRYLDHMDRRIRRYVTAKRKLIALLEEEKQAIVNRAVTRGLDPNVRLKPSGVEWLGDVPEHWEMVQLGRIGKFSKGGGGTKEDEVDVGLPCIRYGDIYMNHKYHIERSRSYISPEQSSNYTPMEYGDLLFAGSGETIDEIGKSAVNLLGEEAYCGGDVILFRPKIEMTPRFTGYAADCVQSAYQKSRMGRGITIMHIYSSQLKYMRLALPPVAEQSAIAEYLDKATANIDTATARARRQIELLQEYRTRLIADVVTGKLDVREMAAQLPDEADDQDPIGESGPLADGLSRDHLRCQAINRRGGDGMTDWSKCPAVESVPGKVSGAWVFKDTRLPVSALFGNLAEGATVHDFIEWFGGVDETQVRAVLEFIVQDLDAKVAKVSHANPV